MATQRERRNVFGEAVDDYDTYRPDYPAALVDEVLAAAGPGPVLEVGAGTGKATVAFSARGIDLTCLEPDARMASVLRRHVPEVTVLESTFESWVPDRGYGLLYSAQAWHWIEPARRSDLAYAALVPGGLVALFWNVAMLADPVLHAALAEVDARYFPVGEHTGHGWLAGNVPREIRKFSEEWPDLGLYDGRFTDLESRRYSRASQSYSSADYSRYLATTSLYRMLGDGERESVLADTAAVIDAQGGTITLVVDTDLALGRKR